MRLKLVSHQNRSNYYRAHTHPKYVMQRTTILQIEVNSYAVRKFPLIIDLIKRVKVERTNRFN